MTYTPIDVDYENLTIMGVSFPDLKTLENIACGIGSSMYEGFNPTPKGIERIRDRYLGKISFKQLIKLVEEEYHAKE